MSQTQPTCSLAADTNGLRFTAKADKLGFSNLVPEITTQFGTERITIEKTETRKDGAVCQGRYALSGVTETIDITASGTQGALLKRKVTFSGKGCVSVSDAAIAGLPCLTGFRLNWLARYAHMDNVRVEKLPHSRPDYPYVRPLPLEPTWLGDKESVAFPALIITDDSYDELLLAGQVRQKWTRMRWRLQADPGPKSFKDFCISWQTVGGSITLQSGESIELEPLFLEIRTDTRPPDALGAFVKQCIAHNHYLSGSKNVLNRKGFYCSWNYGIMHDISESSLLKTAACVAQTMPEVAFFLIDGGWQGEGWNTPNCANFYLPEAEWHHAERFPAGLKVMADKIRDTGLRPAIWWTPSVALHSQLAKDHPEWLARNESGAVFRIGNSGYFDLSRPETRGYLEKVWDILFKRWGYEAMKMDFWCQMFESDTIRFGSGTAIEWREWFLKTLRGYIPEDGFLMTCVATAMGNIHLGNHAESYRCGIDIGHYCDWLEHPLAAYWMLPLLDIPGRDTTLLNADGFGVNLERTDDENIHRLTWGFITMGSVEVDGRLEELPPRYLEWVRRFASNIDRGYAVKCPEEEPYAGRPFPKILYVDYPKDSPTVSRGVAKHIALFNWENKPRRVAATAAQLGLCRTTTAREFWTDESVTLENGNLIATLPPHGAKLLEIPV